MKNIYSILSISLYILFTHCSQKKNIILKNDHQLKVSMIASIIDIHEAAIKGNLTDVQEAISNGTDINSWAFTYSQIFSRKRIR